MVEGLRALWGWQPLLAIVAGTAIGILAGAMPGISPSMGVALLVPFTYAMSPELAIILLGAIYLAANYGGSITAVIINAPGTPSAVVTSFDGYPLTQQGKAGMGLGVSLISSVAGGMVGLLALVFFAQPLARVAIRFHPAEYFAVAVFGLTTVASLAGKNWAKAFAMVLLGLLFNTVGIDPISGVSRFTFGSPHLYDGFSLIPALVGLFALSEVLRQIEAGLTDRDTFDARGTAWPTLLDYWSVRLSMLRASLLGALIGIFPGAGATIASFIAYDVEKRCSRTPDQFGKGSLAGVAAAEAANSASVGGSFVPMLTLGIPGSATAAVLIGALMIHDLVPGPLLFKDNPRLVYGLFASLLVANVTLLALGLWGMRLWVKVTAVPKRILFPAIMAVAVIGSFAVRNSLFDVASCLGFGVFGWILRRNDYPVAPIILGMVLGTIVETTFRQAVMMGGYTIFFTRPLSAGILLAALLSFALPLLARRRRSG